jgi:phospholipid/cholesterol/gamma-HCH transport system substrate-binding protein
MATPAAHEGGRGFRDQLERYRSSFIAVIVVIVLAAVVGGYILAHQNLKLPGWVPVLGRNFYTLKGEFQTAQAVTPGQGQAVTIAGAKIGEIESVELHQGVAIVTMKVTPKYARFYRNATMLLRPKTQLQDMTVEVNPGTPSAGKLKEGEVIPQSQTAPNVDFDEFLAGLDADTRAYLQLLLAGAGEGFKENGRAFSAVLKRFDPTSRLGQEIAAQLEIRHANIARSIHNFRLLTEALGGKDKELAQLIDASNAVFATFASEEQNLQRTLHLLPNALHKTAEGIGKLGVASSLVGPTLHQLLPFAHALAPSNAATQKLARETTPIIKNEIRPFAREILPVVNELKPSTQALAEAFPQLATSFAVLNEFFNELGYNPGPNKAGFLFFADWGAHNLNSVVSTADAHGPVGRSLLFFNCEVLPLLRSAALINPQVNVLVSLLKPPTKQDCAAQGLPTTAGAASTHSSAAGAGGVFSGLSTPFGGNGNGNGRGGAPAPAATPAPQARAHTAGAGG